MYIYYVCMCVCMYVVGESGKVANPARGQLNRENIFFAVPVRASRVRPAHSHSHSHSPHSG